MVIAGQEWMILSNHNGIDYELRGNWESVYGLLIMKGRRRVVVQGEDTRIDSIVESAKFYIDNLIKGNIVKVKKGGI